MEFYFFGCTANLKEGEILKQKVKKVVNNLKQKNLINEKQLNNLVFIMSCAVKGPTENRILSLIKNLKKEGKTIIVSGCLALAYPKRLEKEKVLIIGENFLNEKDLEQVILNKIKQKILKNNQLNEKIKKERLVLTGDFVEKIEINRGCLGNCSFCATKLAIPSFFSYKIKDIINLINESYKKGVKEILLTSQDCGAFGLDNGENLLQLIEKINNWYFSLRNKRKDFFIRIGMANPNFLGNIIDELLKEMSSPIFYKFLHIPVQSGNNELLEKMNRGYLIEEWLKIAKKIKKKKFSLATDIIVGYPGETEEQFKDSLKLFDLVEIDIVNISKFWPRPKTKAYLEWKKNKIDEKIIKDRVKLLNSKFEEKLKKINEKYLKENKETFVLLNEIDKQKNDLKGKTIHYKQVVLKENNLKLGELKKVKLLSFQHNTFFAQIIQ